MHFTSLFTFNVITFNVITFIFLTLLTQNTTRASIQFNDHMQIINVNIGGNFPLFEFSLSTEIRFQVANTSTSAFSAGEFTFDTVYIGSEVYTARIDEGGNAADAENADNAANAANANIITLGWYSSQNPVVTLMGPELFPYRHDKMLLGTGVTVEIGAAGKARGTTTLILPNSTVATVPVIFESAFGSDTHTIHLPQSITPTLDRTQNLIYTFPDISLQVSTLDALETYTLQTWNKSYVSIGMLLPKNGMQKLALTYDREQVLLTVWGAYDETILYTPENQIFIVFLSLFALAWYLYFLNADELTFAKNSERYDLKSIFVSYAGTVLACGVVLRQIFVYALFTRMQYVTLTSIFEYSITIACAMAIIAFVHIYTTWDIHTAFELRRATFDTLLVLSVGSIFVGRTEVCEETVLCFVIAAMWTPFQLMSIGRCPGYSRLILLIQFLLIYPLVAILLVEPLIATVPELAAYTWPSSQLVMFFPPLLLLGLWTVMPDIVMPAASPAAVAALKRI